MKFPSPLKYNQQELVELILGRISYQFSLKKSKKKLDTKKGFDLPKNFTSTYK